MATYYFTYGLGEDTKQAYQGGGWTEVEAENAEQAVALYKVFHPLTDEGLLPCCGVAYTYDHMVREYPSALGRMSMLKDGNGGKFCRDRISAKQEVF